MPELNRLSEDERKSAPNLALAAAGILFFRLAGQPITIIASLLVANLLGPEQKGLAALTRVLPSFAAAICGLGIATSLKYAVSRKDYALAQVGVTSLFLSTVQGLFAGAGYFYLLTTGWLGPLALQLPTWIQLSSACLIPMLLLRQTLFMGFAGNMDFRIQNVLDFISGLLFASLSIFFVMYFNLGFAGVYAAFGIATLLTLGAGFSVFLTKYKPSFQLQPEFMKFSYHYGFRAWIGTLAQRGNVSLDQFFLGILAPARALGNYSVAVSMARLLYMVPQAVAPVFMNQVAESKGSIDPVKIARVHRSLILLICLGGTAIALIALIVAPLLLPQFSDVPVLILILLPGALFFSSFKILGSYFVGSGQPEKSSYCQFIALLGSIVSYPSLVPMFGGYGAAAASTCVYFVMYLLIVWMFRKAIVPREAKLFSLSGQDFSWLYAQASRALHGFRLRSSDQQHSLCSQAESPKSDG